MKRLTLLKVTYSNAAGIFGMLESALQKMETNIVRKRSVYHTNYDIVHGRAKRFAHVKKAVTFKKGSKKTPWVGKITTTETTISLYSLAPQFKALPGKEDIVMTIGINDPLHIYEGDTVSIYQDTDKELVILIKQNTENKKKQIKSKYNTVIRK